VINAIRDGCLEYPTKHCRRSAIQIRQGAKTLEELVEAVQVVRVVPRLKWVQSFNHNGDRIVSFHWHHYISAQAEVLELRIRKAGEIIVGGRRGVMVGAGLHNERERDKRCGGRRFSDGADAASPLRG